MERSVVPYLAPLLRTLLAPGEREREETDKDLSRERAQSDIAVATRDEFLGIVSHDLRNMLHVMVGFAALIENDTDPSKHVQYAQRVRRSGARMKRLLGDLLDIASIEAGKLAVVREAVDPAAVVAEAVEGFQTQAAERHIDLRQECVPGSSRASLDPARVLQVLVNLLSNSLKFTPAGGSVIVRLEPTDEQLLFSVEDSGVGIAPANLAAIFGRFRQLDEKDRRGVGLGLYISQCIVEGHGGHIWAESVLGKGSTFSFTIPADAGA